ncbi:MAG: hypothetical protein ABI675_31180 [Chitinophagaceae bacterium]
MAYTTGKSKSLDNITLDDALKYPIWEWALDEEKKDGQDETWQRPIVGSPISPTARGGHSLKLCQHCPTLFLAHCKAHKSRTQKLTLQRAKNAKAQQTHPI